MTIAIVGIPGSGKSTVGRLLAQRLHVPFTDVDALIEEQTGREIRDIFAEDGEAAFRRLEVAATTECLQRAGVVSLGGGAVLSPVIRDALAGHEVVWLQVSITHATRRVGLNVVRPLLLGNVRSQLVKLMHEREPLYAQVATLPVITDDLRAPEVVAEIVRRSPEAQRLAEGAS